MTRLWDLAPIQTCEDIVLPGETVAEMFWNAAQQRGPQVWMRQKELGVWRSWTWAQTAEAVAELGCGLISQGFEAGDTASILSNTVIEWVLADLAVLSCGGVSNGVYPTDAAEQLHYLCEDSRSRVLFVEDDEQLDKALEVRARLPGLRLIVVFDMKGLRELDEPGVPGIRMRFSGGSRPAGPMTWPSSSTPRAPPAGPRVRCTPMPAWSTPFGATTACCLEMRTTR